jgi:hypothetical protein
MTSRTNLPRLALCFLATASALIGLAAVGPAQADEPGDAQKKAAAQAAPSRPLHAPPPGKTTPDTAALGERVEALEKENIVLREDLGKARLDARTRLSELEQRDAEARARMQEKIDALRAELESERRKQAKRNRNLWIAAGVLAIGIIAAAD